MLKKKITYKQIKINLLSDMRNDIELKKYIKDIKDLNQKQFKILLNIFKKIKTSF